MNTSRLISLLAAGASAAALTLMASTAAHAGATGIGDASANMFAPLTISQSQPLDFSTHQILNPGETCQTDVDPGGAVTSDCMTAGAPPTQGRFDVTGEPSSFVSISATTAFSLTDGSGASIIRVDNGRPNPPVLNLDTTGVGVVEYGARATFDSTLVRGVHTGQYQVDIAYQ